MKFTILGSSGFIGSHLADHLRRRQIECWTPKRGDPSLYRKGLGHLIYCIGLTADFRKRPYETVDAHVCTLLEILKRCKYSSFLYLSSTRLYGIGSGIANEEDSIRVAPVECDHLYNISKAQGESLCFVTGNPRVRVVRLSNVYGDDLDSENFLPSLIRDAIKKKRLFLETSLDSAKDYISVKNVVDVLPKIAICGLHRIYNIASGGNTTNNRIAKQLRDLTGCRVVVSKKAKRIRYPVISIKRIKQEFGFCAGSISDDLYRTVNIYRTHKARKR